MTDADAEAAQPGSLPEAGSERCSSCDVQKALGWRLDRASKQLVCNRCYLRSYKPAQLDEGILLLAGEGKKPKGRARKSKDSSDNLAEEREEPSEAANGAAADVPGFPASVRVECSPVERVNGIYARAADLMNGKPYYNSQGSKKVTQLFLQGKEWKFGNVNKSGFYAKVKADKALSLPTEPHPFAWRVIADKSGDARNAPAMRVIDMDLDALLPPEANLPNGFAAHSTTHSRKRHSITHGSATEKRRKSGELAPRDGSAEAKDAESAGEPRESSEDESESSESESSSSSSGSEPPPPPPPVNGSQGLNTVNSSGATERFKEKLQVALQRASTKECRAKLKQLYNKRHDYVKVAGMSLFELVAFCDQMYEAHGKPEPKPPQGLPPMRLFEQAGIPFPTPAPRPASAPSGSGEATAPGASPGPAPDSDEEELMPHRRRSQRDPKKGCLLSNYLGKFNPQAKRISFYDNGSGDDAYNTEKSRQEIQTMRGYLSHLWFVQPGALVNCDHCNQDVPLGCGFLQGVPGGPQFAQNTFVCHSCM